MNKFRLLALALAIGTSSLFAFNSTPELAKKEIRTEIVELLKTPDFDIEKDVNVLMTFTFSSEGEIVILNVNSKDREILNYIRENLNYKKIDSPGERDKIYTMPLTLKIK